MNRTMPEMFAALTRFTLAAVLAAFGAPVVAQEKTWLIEIGRAHV